MDLAIKNYKRFCELEGSEYIASEFALETILKIIRIFNIETVLELGLGIGSVSDTVYKYTKNKNNKINYFGTEKNEYCLESLKKNVTNYGELQLFSELNQIRNFKFDLIIIDGYDNALNQMLNYCEKHSIIFIEGDRSAQRNAVLNIFPKSKYVNVITLSKNKSYAHGGSSINNYVGGGQLIFINPTFKMNLFWWQQKVVTFIKNKIRTYKNK